MIVGRWVGFGASWARTSRSLADEGAKAYAPSIRWTRQGLRIVATVVQVSSTPSRATTLASVRTGRGRRWCKLEPADLVGFLFGEPERSIRT